MIEAIDIFLKAVGVFFIIFMIIYCFSFIRFQSLHSGKPSIFTEFYLPKQ